MTLTDLEEYELVYLYEQRAVYTRKLKTAKENIKRLESKFKEGEK